MSKSRGVVYRAVDHVFSSLRALAQHGWTFKTAVEMVEVYNEQVRDLLSDEPLPLDSSTSGLEIKHLGKDGAGQAIPGLKSVSSSSRQWLPCGGFQRDSTADLEGNLGLKAELVWPACGRGMSSRPRT
jgi:hypothetical protein